MIRGIFSGNAVSADARLHPSALYVGTWTGTWNKTDQFTFTIKSIRGTQAVVSYTHGGNTQNGVATFTNGLIEFGNITFSTRNGQTAAAIYQIGTLNKQATLVRAKSPSR